MANAETAVLVERRHRQGAQLRRRARVMATMVAALACTGRAFGQSAVVDTAVHLTIAGVPAQGTLWVCYNGNNLNFEYFKLADVTAGLAHVVLSETAAKGLEDRSTSSTAWVLVLEDRSGLYLEQLWHLRDIPSILDGWGAVSDDRGQHSVDLPSPVMQELRLDNPDGSPRANQTVFLAQFVSIIGPCARIIGLGEKRLTTDADGTARFVAPLGKLYLAADFYEQRTFTGRTVVVHV